MWIQEIRFNLLKCTFKQYHRRMRAFVTLQPRAFHHITPILDDIQYNGIALSVTLLIYNFTLVNLQWSKTSKVVLVQTVQASSHCAGQASKNVLMSSRRSCRAGKVAYSFVRPAERDVSDSPQNKQMNREKWFWKHCIMVKNLHSVVLKKKTSNDVWEFFSAMQTLQLPLRVVTFMYLLSRLLVVLTFSRCTNRSPVLTIRVDPLLIPHSLSVRNSNEHTE